MTDFLEIFGKKDWMTGFLDFEKMNFWKFNDRFYEIFKWMTYFLKNPTM